MRKSLKSWMPWMAAVVVAGSLGTARAELLLFLEGDKVNTPAPSVILDSSGKGNHGLASGNSGLSSNAKNGAGSVNSGGTGSTIRFNTAGTGAFDSISDNQAFTVAFWMYGADSNPVNSSTFWAVGAPGNTDRAFQAHIPWSNENVYFDVGGCCGGTQRVNTQIARQYWRGSDGGWTHWAFTVEPDFGDAAVYINGEIATGVDGVTQMFRAGPTSFIPPLQRLWLGSADNGGNAWQGQLDDVIIADTALSQAQIQQLMNTGVRSVFPGLPAEAPTYTPAVSIAGGFSNLGGKLAGYLDAPAGVTINSWRVGRIFEQVVNKGTPNETVVRSVLDLGGVSGFSGAGEFGSAGAHVQIGDLSLAPTAEDQVFKMRFSANATAEPGFADPILGANFTAVIDTDLLVPGTGGGGIPPFVLMGDLNQDGQIGLADFNILKSNFGATQGSVPEPSTVVLAVMGLASMLVLAVRRRK